jgi:hypothetical protein
MLRFGTRDPLSVIESWLDIALKVVGRYDKQNGVSQYKHTFFCNRTMLVHFFSSNVSYFFAVAASKTSSPRLNSALSAAAVFGKLFADRYAIIDLCLGTQR